MLATRVERDAQKVLEALSRFGRQPTQKEQWHRGYLTLDAEALANKTGLCSERLADAVALLCETGRAEVDYSQRPYGYHFRNVQVTAKGKAEFEARQGWRGRVRLLWRSDFVRMILAGVIAAVISALLLALFRGQ